MFQQGAWTTPKAHVNSLTRPSKTKFAPFALVTLQPSPGKGPRVLSHRGKRGRLSESVPIQDERTESRWKHLEHQRCPCMIQPLLAFLLSLHLLYNVITHVAESSLGLCSKTSSFTLETDQFKSENKLMSMIYLKTGFFHFESILTQKQKQSQNINVWGQRMKLAAVLIPAYLPCHESQLNSIKDLTDQNVLRSSQARTAADAIPNCLFC